MQTLGVFKGSVRSRWIEQGFGKTPLILSGQAEDGMRLNGSLGGIWAVLAARQPPARSVRPTPRDPCRWAFGTGVPFLLLALVYGEPNNSASISRAPCRTWMTSICSGCRR